METPEEFADDIMLWDRMQAQTLFYLGYRPMASADLPNLRGWQPAFIGEWAVSRTGFIVGRAPAVIQALGRMYD